MVVLLEYHIFLRVCRVAVGPQLEDELAGGAGGVVHDARFHVADDLSRLDTVADPLEQLGVMLVERQVVVAVLYLYRVAVFGCPLAHYHRAGLRRNDLLRSVGYDARTEHVASRVKPRDDLPFHGGDELHAPDDCSGGGDCGIYQGEPSVAFQLCPQERIGRGGRNERLFRCRRIVPVGRSVGQRRLPFHDERHVIAVCLHDA